METNLLSSQNSPVLYWRLFCPGSPSRVLYGSLKRPKRFKDKLNSSLILLTRFESSFFWYQTQPLGLLCKCVGSNKPLIWNCPLAAAVDSPKHRDILHTDPLTQLSLLPSPPVNVSKQQWIILTLAWTAESSLQCGPTSRLWSVSSGRSSAFVCCPDTALRRARWPWRPPALWLISWRWSRELRLPWGCENLPCAVCSVSEEDGGVSTSRAAADPNISASSELTQFMTH